MTPAREMFWNIQWGNLVYLLGAIIAGLVFYALYRRYQVYRRAQPDNRLEDLPRRIWSFAVLGVVDGLAHRRLLRHPYSGVMHLLIFGGALVLLVGTVLDPLSHYFFHFLHGSVYLWTSLFLDVAGAMILIGLGMAFFRRYVHKPERLNNITDDAVVLSVIFLIVVTGFVLEGLRVAETELQAHPEWAVWSPVGFAIARGTSGLAEGARLMLHQSVWWFHVLLFFGGVVYASFAFSKFGHILAAPANIFFRSLRPRAVPVPIDIMKAESFGVGKAQDFTWKQLLDLDACTRCGRCQDNCPAHLTGKSLSPKTLVHNLKAHLWESYPRLVASNPGGADNPGSGGVPLIGEVVSEEELWACTTCGACEEMCPVLVEHTSKIIDMRRNLVLEQARLPKSAQASLVNTQQRGHPWKGTSFSRSDWFSDMEVTRSVEGGEPGLLFWVGCTGALVERNVRVTAAFAKLLARAGVDFTVLGESESCCGHFARRLGDEYLFQVQVEKNIETLKAHNVERIVTTCPHCYHTLKNEYPQFGGRFAVLHHTQVILDLLQKGRLSLDVTTVGRAVTYQDPCYLGRCNNMYRAPRKALSALPNVKLVEMPRHGPRALCCGAGGGRMWIEEPPGQRVNQLRVKEAAQTGAGVIATACPLCLQMFDDAIKALEREDSMKAMDLAELIVGSLVPLPGGTIEVPAEPAHPEQVLATSGTGARLSSA